DVARELLRRCGDETSGGVEPLVGRPLIARQRNVLQVAKEDDVAEALRRTALVREDRVDLPTSPDRVERFRHVASEMTPAPERQLDDRLNVEAVRPVEPADRAVDRRVASVEEADRIHVLRERVA